MKIGQNFEVIIGEKVEEIKEGVAESLIHLLIITLMLITSISGMLMISKVSRKNRR